VFCERGCPKTMPYLKALDSHFSPSLGRTEALRPLLEIMRVRTARRLVRTRRRWLGTRTLDLTRTIDVDNRKPY
jgi:hypothetical protein